MKSMVRNKSKTINALQKLVIKKEIDALFIVAGAPVEMLTNLPAAAKNRIQMLPIDDDTYNRLAATYPYKRKTIKASTYGWLTQDVNTISVDSAIVGNAKMSKAQVKSIVAKIFKNQSKLIGKHQKWKELNKATVKEYVSKYKKYFHAGTIEYINSI